MGGLPLVRAFLSFTAGRLDNPEDRQYNFFVFTAAD